MTLTRLAIACSLMGMAAGCAPSAPLPTTPVVNAPGAPGYSAADAEILARGLKRANQMLAEPPPPTAAQIAESTRVLERASPRCQFEAAKATPPHPDAVARQQAYFVLLASCVRASR